MVEDAISFWTDIQRYEDMLAADPRSYCFAPLSELYRKLGLLDDAISVAQKGCDMHPDYPGGFLTLGAACYQKGLNAEARQALERVLSLNPDHLQAQKLLGQLYVEAGETDLAKKVLGQVLRQNPDDLESTLLLRSIASTGTTEEPEEEIIEDADVIEELDEFFDEPEEPETVAAFEATQSPGTAKVPGAAKVPEVQGGSGNPGVSDLDPLEEIWAIEPPEEPATQRPAAKDPLTTATLAELYVTQGYVDKALRIYQELLSADPTNQHYRLRCAEVAEIRELQQTAQQPVQQQPVQQQPVQQQPIQQQPIQQQPIQQQPIQQQPIQQQPTRPQPIRQEPAAPALRNEAPAVQGKATPPRIDVETELSSWLENIRRRRDGV